MYVKDQAFATNIQPVISRGFHALAQTIISVVARYSDDTKFREAADGNKIDWSKPWLITKSVNSTDAFGTAPANKTIEDFRKGFPEAESCKTSHRRARTPWLPGLGQAETMQALSKYTPPDDRVVELGSKSPAPVNLMRLSKTFHLFGFMEDCVYVETEPDFAGQLRCIHDGELDFYAINIEEMTKGVASCKGISDMVTAVSELKTIAEVSVFAKQVVVVHFLAKALRYLC